MIAAQKTIQSKRTCLVVIDTSDNPFILFVSVLSQYNLTSYSYKLIFRIVRNDFEILNSVILATSGSLL